MAPTRNARVLTNENPTGYPEPGKTLVYDDSSTINVDSVPLNGGFLLKTLFLSIDPYMRGRMDTADSYIPCFQLGKPIVSGGIAVVIRSENGSVKVGDHVFGMLDHQEYNVKHSLDKMNILKNRYDLPWSVYLGAAGMPGYTSFVGWKKFALSKPGDVIFVTTGGGMSCGSMVIQLAKAEGLKVIASAGSEEKVAFMKEIGADVTFNYKTTNTRQVLQKEGPIDIFWDNVGGEILEAALGAASLGARFIECGMISGYNTGGAPVRNLFLMIGKDINMRGFIQGHHPEYREEFYATIPEKLAKGEMKYREEITRRLDKVGDVMLALQKGTNKGKAVIHVADK